MRALFAPVDLDTVEYGQANNRPQQHFLTHPTRQKDACFLQLEIQTETLQRLILENRLVAEEIHCLNRGSQITYKKMLLNNLEKPIRI